MGVTLADPEVAPLAPVTGFVQEVALVDDQVSVDDWPLVIEAGLALSEAVGETAPPDAKISTCCVNQAVLAPLDEVAPDDVPLEAITSSSTVTAPPAQFSANAWFQPEGVVRFGPSAEISDSKTSEFAAVVLTAAEVWLPQLLKFMAPTAPMGELPTPVYSDISAVA